MQIDRTHRRAAFGAFAILAVIAAALAHGATPPPQSPPKPRPQPPAQPVKPSAENPREYVLLTTSMGDIVLELNREKAPISTANFLEYANSKFYNGTIFHRVMDNFMIQGGGMTADMTEKKNRSPIKNEWQNGLKNTRGTVAMARLNRQADSATSQFFINVKDNAGLDQPNDGAGYAVFGKVVAGMGTVDKIKAVATTSKGNHQNVPVETITIKEAKHISEKDAKERIDAEKKPGG